MLDISIAILIHIIIIACNMYILKIVLFLPIFKILIKNHDNKRSFEKSLEKIMKHSDDIQSSHHILYASHSTAWMHEIQKEMKQEIEGLSANLEIKTTEIQSEPALPIIEETKNMNIIVHNLIKRMDHGIDK